MINYIKGAVNSDKKDNIDIEQAFQLAWSKALDKVIDELIQAPEFKEKELNARSIAEAFPYYYPILKYKDANIRHLKRKKEKVLERVVRYLTQMSFNNYQNNDYDEYKHRFLKRFGRNT